MEEFSKPNIHRPMSDYSKQIIAEWSGYKIGKVYSKDCGTYHAARGFYNRLLALKRHGHIIGKVAMRLNVIEMRREG